MRVVHVITGLSSGGAEGMLLKLLSVRQTELDPIVVSLGQEGPIGRKISDIGISVSSLNLNSGFPNPVKLLSFASLIRRFRPQLIQGWMPHGNLMALLAGTTLRNRARVLWNVRMSLDDLGSEPKLTVAVIRMCARLSGYADRIIYNSETGARQHEWLGYRPDRTAVIPNGFDCEIFRPSMTARKEVRAELGISSDAILVGLIARYHPMKDHANFLRAAGSIARQHPNVYFLLAGCGIDTQQPGLMQWISEQQLQGRVFLLGERQDIPRLTAALDIACSASARAEGFSNAIGEAMACGVPCVATAIGDNAAIISDTGLSVAAGAPAALVAAISRLVCAGKDHRCELGMAARLRIEREFSLTAIADRYLALYRSVLSLQQKRHAGSLVHSEGREKRP